MNIRRKIYYDKATGNVILHLREQRNVFGVIETTFEQDVTTFIELSSRNVETIGWIVLEVGQYAQDFVECTGFRVDPSTERLEFSYPDPHAPEADPVYQQPLTDQVEVLKKESTLLKAQNNALTERTDFHEDLIAEMAMIVYS